MYFGDVRPCLGYLYRILSLLEQSGLAPVSCFYSHMWCIRRGLTTLDSKSKLLMNWECCLTVLDSNAPLMSFDPLLRLLIQSLCHFTWSTQKQLPFGLSIKNYKSIKRCVESTKRNVSPIKVIPFSQYLL